MGRPRRERYLGARGFQLPVVATFVIRRKIGLDDEGSHDRGAVPATDHIQIKNGMDFNGYHDHTAAQRLCDCR